MSNVDLFSEVKAPTMQTFELVADGVYDMNYTANGIGFDTANSISGFIYLQLLVPNGLAEFVLQHSDDNSTWEDIPAENLLGDTITALDDEKGFGSQGFFGTKRYVGVQVTVSEYDTHKGTTGNTVTIGVTLVKRVNLAS